MSNRLPIIAVTPGDCTGIGPEQTARILADRRLSDRAALVVVGDSARRRTRQAAGGGRFRGHAI